MSEPAAVPAPEDRPPRASSSGKDPPKDATRILSAIEGGDPHAAEELLPLVYAELRKLAARKLSQGKPGQTLQATALVHEAYLRLVDVEKAQYWDSRGHFFAAAAEAMRRILIEGARRKKQLRRGGDRRRVPLEDADAVEQLRDDDVLTVDLALGRLEESDPLAANLVKLRLRGLAHARGRRSARNTPANRRAQLGLRPCVAPQEDLRRQGRVLRLRRSGSGTVGQKRRA